MPADLTITGVDRLSRLSSELRRVGDSELRRELYRGISRATVPMKQAAQKAARDKLPRRGGLNEWVARARFSTSSRGGGRNPGVRIRAKRAGHDLAALDRGRLRHPVYGNRRAWVTQRIPAGWFSDTLAREAPKVRRELVAVFDTIARRLRG